MIAVLLEMAAEVRDHQDDAEHAHSAEDDLHVVALRYIEACTTVEEARMMATIALSTRTLKFSRWTA